MQSADKMIGNIDQIGNRLNSEVVELREEIAGIREQWSALSKLGGQRADHAAALMARLRSHLVDIARFATAVDSQLAELGANPFGRDEKNPAA